MFSLKDLKESAWSLIKETPVEVFVLAGVGAIIAATISFGQESAKLGQIPLAFSEIGKTELYVEKIGGGKIPPLTRFYSSTNDMVMQIFESNNIARNRWGWTDRAFARELETKIDPNLRIHTLYTDYTKVLPSYAEASKGVLGKMDSAATDLIPISKALSDAWDEDHDDVYHTEYYTTTSCDSKNNCTTETHTREVYDYTIHTYRYNATAGRVAVSLLNAFKVKHPDVYIDERLMLPSDTEAENEWAMRESRKHMKDYKLPSQEQYLAWARSWATGSNYVVLAPSIYRDHANVLAQTPLWASASGRSRYHRYTTYSHSDDGPKEYQVAERLLESVNSEQGNISRIIGGIDYAVIESKALEKKMLTYVDIVLHGKKGNASKLRREIVQDARNIYEQNYAGGFDVHPAKWGFVFLWFFLGGIIGGVIGFGIDRLIAWKTENY